MVAVETYKEKIYYVDSPGVLILKEKENLENNYIKSKELIKKHPHFEATTHK